MNRRQAYSYAVFAVGVAVALFVTWQIGVFPVVDYCPQSELVCAGGFNPKNIPSLAGGILSGTAVTTSMILLERRVDLFKPPNAE